MEGKHVIMDAQQKGIKALVKSALTGNGCEVPVGFDLGLAANIAKEHQITPLLYYGAAKCGFPTDTDVMRQLFMSTCAHLSVSESQLYEINRIYNAFEEANVDYMPLKGAVLKGMYPKTEMRAMGDADILIRTEQYVKICSIMMRMGYVFQYESDHELVWSKENALTLELHKSIMTSYNKDFYSYFGDGWKLARQKYGSRFEMSDEDFYIYIFVHFTKHYRVSGIGMKHLIDLWVYKNAKPLLEWEYIKNELKKLRLYEFFENVEKTLDVWFATGEETFETKLISDTVFGSGAYGHAEISEASKIIREAKGKDSFVATKFIRWWKLVFLSYNQMCEKYKVLKKIPVLLPLMWIVRLFNIAIFKRDKMNNFIDRQKRLTNDAIYKQKEKLNAVGLDFYSEEDIS